MSVQNYVHVAESPLMNLGDWWTCKIDDWWNCKILTDEEQNCFSSFVEFDVVVIIRTSASLSFVAPLISGSAQLRISEFGPLDDWFGDNFIISGVWLERHAWLLLQEPWAVDCVLLYLEVGATPDFTDHSAAECPSHSTDKDYNSVSLLSLVFQSASWYRGQLKCQPRKRLNP